MLIRRWYGRSLIVGSVLLSLLPPRAACADEKASRLLKEVVAVYKAMRTLSADFAVHQELPGAPAMEMTGTFKAQKPNRFAIDCAGALSARMTSDGKSVLFLLKPQNAYAQMPANGQAMNLTVTTVAPLTFFFNPGKLLAPDTPTTYLGTETWEGTVYELVEQTLGPSVMRFFIAPNRVIARLKVHLEQGGQKQDVEAALRNIRLDAPLTPADFPTTPPKGTKPFEMPTFGGKPLFVGQEAPNFTLPRPTGGEITLAEAMQGKKAVLVTFWFYACATCRQEFPRLQALYKEFKAKGLEIIAINSNDEPDTIRKYLRQTHGAFPVGMDDVGDKHFGITKQYGVSLYPTTYLLDSSGKVAACLVGFQEKELRAALAKLGVP